MKVCMVHWIDPTVLTDWTSVDQLSMEMDVIVSVGLVIKESDEAVVLALSYDESVDRVNCVKIIPKSLIVTKRVFDWRCDCGKCRG